MSAAKTRLAPWACAWVAGAALCAAPAHSATSASGECRPPVDVLHVDDPLAAPVRPPPCTTVTQSPPELTWPEVRAPRRQEMPQRNGKQEQNEKPEKGKPQEYLVSLQFPDGHVETRSAPQNWLAWDRALPPGTYRWTVALPDGRKSEPRAFTIARGAVPFVIPSGAAAVAHAKGRPHPRSWPDDASSPIPALKAERARAFAGLLAEVDAKIATPVQPEPVAESINANYDDTVAEQKRTLAAALAWAVTKQRRYGADAARRLMAQAQWSAAGPLSFANNDMGSRTVAWTLALGYDWAHDYLTVVEREEILAAIAERTRDMFERHVASRDILRHPYDSHGNLTLTITAAIAALVAGDLPEADRWLEETLPAAAAWTSPWGGADGGFANGTMQGQWDTGANLLAWYVLKGAAGVDLARKEWVRNHSRFLAYFAPPGAPAGLFGDGQEMDAEEPRARVGKALARFAPTPLGEWYAARLEGEDGKRVELLLAPRRARARDGNGHGKDPAVPNAAHFPSIGWVAMHSDLADPARTSVYFRSSPYGAFNHGHADQNGFVIDHRGERLAIKSGYYDDYKTPHWREWYKATRSANAITFDGGQGQGPDGKEFAGEIARFESDGKVDRAVGRAHAAYGGALTRAVREIVFVRPNLVLVYDDLASETPRTWEWNLHALERMQPHPDGRLSVRKGEAAMCVEMVASPLVAFSQTDRFATPPAGERPAQWHGTFATTRKSPRAEFVTLMRIGSACGKDDATASARRDPKGWEVQVGATAVRLAGDAAPPSRVAARRGASDVAQQ